MKLKWQEAVSKLARDKSSQKTEIQRPPWDYGIDNLRIEDKVYHSSENKSKFWLIAIVLRLI